MATTTRDGLGGAVLLPDYLQKKALKALRPELRFGQIGRVGVPTGHNSYSWYKANLHDSSTVTTLNSDGTQDGTVANMEAASFTPITAIGTQLKKNVSISDVVLRNSPVNAVAGAIDIVATAISQKYEELCRTELMAGTNVTYGGGKASRSALGASDTLTTQLLTKASTALEGFNAPKIGGCYVGFFHAWQIGDLRTEAGSNSWTDILKYSTPSTVMNGEAGKVSGVRVVQANHGDPISSTVDVYQGLVVGKDAYGIADFQKLQVNYIAPKATHTTPVGDYGVVGGKIMAACKRLEENAMIRIETAATDPLA